MRWINPAPTKCDICNEKLVDTFIDGKTTIGPWGILCEKCFDQYGVGLGTNKGQKYQFDNKYWIKIDG